MEKRKRGQRLNWSKEKERRFAILYPHRTNKHLAALLGLSVSAVKNKGNEMGLRKTFEARSKACREAENSKSRFKPGLVPKNTLPLGTIQTRTRYRMKYYVIKTEKGWVPLQIHRWNEAGMPPIPSHCVLACKTHDVLNCDPSNWEIKDRLETLVIDYRTRSKPRKKRGRRPISNTIKVRRELQQKQEKEQKARAKRTTKAIRTQSVKVTTTATIGRSARRTGFKAPEKKFQIRERGEEVPVKVDHKTTIYIKPGQDPEQAKQAYLARKQQVA